MANGPGAFRRDLVAAGPVKTNRPFENPSFCSSRREPAQIILGIRLKSEPTYVGCYFLNGRLRQLQPVKVLRGVRVQSVD